jgi:hypothetical protein
VAVPYVCVCQSLPGSDEPEPDITSFATTVVEGGDDWRLIRAHEWLTVSDETFSEALIQANALTRYFLGASGMKAIKRSSSASSNHPLSLQPRARSTPHASSSSSSHASCLTFRPRTAPARASSRPTRANTSSS